MSSASQQWTKTQPMSLEHAFQWGHGWEPTERGVWWGYEDSARADGEQMPHMGEPQKDRLLWRRMFQQKEQHVLAHVSTF